MWEHWWEFLILLRGFGVENKIKLHILSLSWNGFEKLNNLKPGLFNNLTELDDNEDIESTWYIRDNGSKDQSVKLINGWLENNVKCFEVGHNRDNFSQGVNYLLDKACPDDNDLILLLNNDVEFNDNVSLSNMVKLMTPDVGAVGAKLLYPESHKLQHAGVIFSEQYGLMPYHFRPRELDDVNSSKNRYFQAVTAAVCLIRASELKRIGGFKIGYSWAFEDVDAMLQIGQNKKIVYCGQVNITHTESATLKLNPVNKLFLNSNVNLFKKNWFGKYEIDHKKYLDNPDYNVIL